MRLLTDREKKLLCDMGRTYAHINPEGCYEIEALIKQLTGRTLKDY